MDLTSVDVASVFRARLDAVPTDFVLVASPFSRLIAAPKRVGEGVELLLIVGVAISHDQSGLLATTQNLSH